MEKYQQVIARPSYSLLVSDLSYSNFNGKVGSHTTKSLVSKLDHNHCEMINLLSQKIYKARVSS